MHLYLYLLPIVKRQRELTAFESGAGNGETRIAQREASHDRFAGLVGLDGLNGLIFAVEHRNASLRDGRANSRQSIESNSTRK